MHSMQHHQQLVRLIEDYLRECKYDRSCKCLQAESAVALESEVGKELREIIVNKDRSLEDALQILSEHDGENQELLYAVSRQHYLELLSSGRKSEALFFLQNSLQKLTSNDEPEDLVSCIFFEENLRKLSLTREQLLAQVSRLINHQHMVPTGRLVELVDQAIASQRSFCTQNLSLDLFTDCGLDMVTTSGPDIIFEHHSGPQSVHAQTWMVTYSNDGKILCVADSERTMRLFTIRNVKYNLEKQVYDLPGKPSIVSFSPDDKHLFIGFDDSSAQVIWDCELNVQGGVYQDNQVGACNGALWIDNTRLVTASPTVKSSVVLRDIQSGTIEYSWSNMAASGVARIRDELFVSCLHSKKIKRIDIHSYEITGELELDSNILSLSSSTDSLFATCDNSTLYMLTLKMDGKIKKKMFKGHENCKFVCAPCLTNDDRFLAMPSEDGRVYVYRLHDTAIVNILNVHKGHQLGAVNVASWNRATGHLAVGGDMNGRVIVWNGIF